MSTMFNAGAFARSFRCLRTCSLIGSPCGFHDGFILRNAGEYLSFFEVSQFLITCKDWRLVLKGTEAPIKKFWKCLGQKVLGGLILSNPQWGLPLQSTYIGCGSLQDFRIHQVFIRLLCDSEIMKGFHVMLTKTNGAKSIKIITKTNFNDRARDLDLDPRKNALKRRKLD